MEEMNEKYKIIAKVITGTGFDYVLGQKETKYHGNEYVTWIKNSRGYDNGHYFSDLKEARLDLIERSAREFDIDLESVYFQKFALENIENALSELYSQRDVETLMKNKEFVSLAYHEYMKTNEPDQALVEILEDLNPDKYLEPKKFNDEISQDLDDYEIEL